MSVNVGVSSLRPDSATAAFPEKDCCDDDVCFLRVSVAVIPAETIVIRLFQKECPKTCRNFRALCNDTGKTNNPPPTTSRTKPYPIYRGCEFHRIMEGFMVQAGDFERFDGTGGYSPIYAGGSFNDESFVMGHDAAGIVSMANSGKNTNKSQFFITLKATPHLNGKHVAFGQVIQGMNVVHQMVSVERNLETGRPVPMQRILITDCGTGWGTSNEDDNTKKKKKQKKFNKDEKKKSKKQKRKRHSPVSDSESDNPSHRKRSGKTRSHRDDPEKGDDDNDEEEEEGKERRRRKTSRRKRPRHENYRRDSSSKSYGDDDGDDCDDEDSLSKDSDDSSTSRQHSKKGNRRKHDGKKRKHKSRR
jgi:peptidyl-prolyl isomerase G (cyclophilin G)